MSTLASLIIPAHDEARTLRRLLGQIEGVTSRFDVIVVANGCTDRTAEIARSCSGIRLVELREASKVAALNAGDSAARSDTRIYIDADVSIRPETLVALAELLHRDEPLVASPSVVIDQDGSTPFARAYQKIWALSDYRLNAHTGSGVYGISAVGRRRFNEFPDVIADDLYVHRLFKDDERATSPGEPFVIHAPRTLRAQVRRLRRTMAGEVQLEAIFPAAARRTGGRRRLLVRVAKRPLLWPAFVVYSYAYFAGKMSARAKVRSGQMRVWERDVTSR